MKYDVEYLDTFKYLSLRYQMQGYLTDSDLLNVLEDERNLDDMKRYAKDLGIPLEDARTPTKAPTETLFGFPVKYFYKGKEVDIATFCKDVVMLPPDDETNTKAD